jgi:hypothetical protein
VLASHANLVAMLNAMLNTTPFEGHIFQHDIEEHRKQKKRKICVSVIQIPGRNDLLKKNIRFLQLNEIEAVSNNFFFLSFSRCCKACLTHPTAVLQ